MFEISRDKIFTTERHEKFLRTPTKRYRISDFSHTETTSLFKFAETARNWIADPENKALGLAAQQVGSKISWFVMNMLDGRSRIIVNPEIIGRSGNKKYVERCFSEPGVSERVKRSRSVTATFFEVTKTEHGFHMQKLTEELYGRDAEVFQHEYEHLQGKLIVDKKKKTKQQQKGWF